MTLEEITAVTETTIGDKTILSWQAGDEFGELTIDYNDGKYLVDAEYMSLESVAAIMSKWLSGKV